MLRLIYALFLSLTLALTSLGMAVARGQNIDMGTDMVICTGVGMITVTIGADGQPVKTTHICPDAMTIFAAGFVAFNMPLHGTALQWRVVMPQGTRALAQEILTPLARGPPLVV